MTSLLSPLAAAPLEGALDEPVRRADGRDVAAGCTVALALLAWAGPLTHGTGGRAVWVLALALLSLMPAMAVLRPWARLPAWQVLVAMSPAAAALVVCLTAPTGFDGLDETASFAYCGGLYLVVRSWAVDGLRRRLLLIGVALVGLEQFTQAYLPWWGAQSVRTLMTGTFYWHNQFAAFMLGTGLVAGVLAVRGTGPLRRTGWLTAPWCFAALLFAGSRAALAVFALAWTVVVVLSFVDRRGRRAALLLLGVALALATLLTSPLLMEDSGWFTSTVQAREADANVEGNGSARVDFWRAAVDLGSSHPLTGAGFDSFGSAGSARMPMTPGGNNLSTYVHNAYLQAFSDGGLILLVALTAATGLPLLVATRLLFRRRRDDDVLAVAVPVALVALVLHAGVDFDWSYPSLAALFAVLAALLPVAAAGDRQRGRRRTLPLAAMVLVLVVAAVPGALRASALRAPEADPPFWAAPFGAVLPLHGAIEVLPATGVCRDELLSPIRSVREHGLACSARTARGDPTLELQRARAEVVNGQVRAGIRRADRVVAGHAEQRPMLRLMHAEVLRLAGRSEAARAELVALHSDLVSRGLPVDALVVQRALHGEVP